ncbi:DUF7793 family protein [Gelidibacter salicanalis]|uniref:DUF7793 domain-containing protein n=1 Tax=Gelidibacter salicanalis TaxID=291193 RepID=A0A934KSY1_9FLAO|nr:hypothetical protein [Gelidibacter salicanalis]MBJ7880152.1 hypothetical protein [Gelidibacter salicanalis]
MVFQNDFATYDCIDGILHVNFKQIILEHDAALCIVRDRLEVQKGLSMPVLCDIRAVRKINKSARSYFALEGSTFLTAVAFVVGPPVSKSLSSYYLHANSHSVPSKIFVDIDDALEFLKTFIED